MKKSYRKNFISLIVLLAMLCIGYATVSYGAPSHGVKFTKHNFGITGTGSFKADSETEICIFCHTPHNAVSGKKFLWNRTNRVTDFQMYTASPTLSFTRSHGNEVSTVSKMCLTCHDGAGAINAMANPRSGGVVAMDPFGDQIGDRWDGPDVCVDQCDWRPNIGQAAVDTGVGPYPDPIINGGGGVLVNDHPISFIYSESRANDATIKTEDGGGTSVGGLPLWYEVLGGYGGYRVECVTCHDPHINYSVSLPFPDASRAKYEPFLRKANYSSSLCFTCHDK